MGENTVNTLSPPPENMLCKMASSEEYIASLENKLKKLKAKRPDEISAKDMISSLSLAKDDYLQHENTSFSCFEDNFDIPDSMLKRLQGRIFPEDVAVSSVELEVLLQHDVLAKATEESLETDKQVDILVK